VTTTLAGIRKAMYDRLPGFLGRVEAVTSAAAQSVTCSSLGQGVSSQRYANQWLLRADSVPVNSSNADRVRYCTTFNGATGQLTHTGVAYTDTSPSGENVEILGWEPVEIDTAIQQTLARLYRRDEEVVATRLGIDRYWLGDMPWIVQPSDILSIFWTPDPVLTRNRYFQKWNGYDTNGNLVADSWTLAGSGASVARSTTQVDMGSYSAKITRAGTDCTFSQALGDLRTGVTTDSLASREVTGVARVWSAVASQVRVQVYDGVATTSSSYHTGNSTWQELSIQHTLDDAATQCTVQVSVEGSNTACYASQCYLVFGQLNDAVRRGMWPKYELQPADFDFNQGNGVLSLSSGPYALGQRLNVLSKRAYPQLDATRFAGGLADLDVIDAPVLHMATGALAYFFRAKANELGISVPGWQQRADDWAQRFENLALAHFMAPDTPMGAPIPISPLGPPARRY